MWDGSNGMDSSVVPARAEAWGATTRSCRDLVLVDESNEKVPPLDVRNDADLFFHS